MKKDIILAGVGGQGIVSIATVIGYAAIQSGLYLKQAEVHGMSQRGGDVQSNLRISDKEIASDIIQMGKADIIISIEPMEALRYVNYLSKDAWIISNTTPFINIPDYPDINNIIKEIKKRKNHILIDADNMAKEINSPKSANIIMLGASSQYLGISYEKLEEAIGFIFNKKGAEVVQQNILALKTGFDFSVNYNKSSH
ncbi:MAG: indolepyruvate oxidoreductase [Bacteroidetes bacterium GWE2_29_8]|nr:MAG: indolepyruvate oxidoreductase [Bacteroidetes bacterium GWE2_29_8]